MYRQTLVRDISERVRAEREILHLKDIHAALSATNEAIVRLDNEKALYQRICQVAVDIAHLTSAWIGMLKDAHLHTAGTAGDYDCFRDAAESGVEQLYRVLHSERSFFWTDRPDQPPEPWHENLRAHGIRQLAILPLRRGGIVVGLLAVTTVESDFIGEAVAGLLHEMAVDIGFALDNYDREVQRRATLQQLQRTASRLAVVVDTAPAGIISLDRDCRITRWNRGAEKIFGWTEQEALGRLPPYVRDEERDRFMAGIAQELDGKPYHDEELWRVRKDGSEVALLLNSTVLRDAQGEIIGLLGALLDITERKRSEDRLRVAATVFESGIDAIFVTDTEARIVAVNPMFTTLMGYRTEEIVGQSVIVLRCESHDDGFYDGIQTTMLREGFWSGEITMRRRDGQTFPAWLNQTVTHAPGGELSHVVCAFSDISESKAAEQRIAQLAHYDPVTDLPNRILFKDRLDQMLAHLSRVGGTIAILFLDLDRFKVINDSLGHPIGDALLRAVSERLSYSVRADDTVCRYGGDEFVLALPAAGNSDSVARVARGILRTFIEPFHIEGHTLVVTPSIGIALAPTDGTDSDTLVRNADTAMYHAKDRGRNNYQFFTSTMNVAALERLTLEAELRQAVEREEFELYFQPIVSLRSGAIISLEALIRWRHPVQGLVLPERFIHIAEDSGLILRIGGWVLREACRYNRLWQQQGLAPVRVAVNISALQLRRGSLHKAVSAALTASGLAPEYLELELTESVLMDQSPTTMQTLEALKTDGIGLVMDDFGTGYSSLNYLRRFFIDKLKIDRSFISEVCHSSHDAAIANAIIAIGHSLGLTVLAEGVETAEQLALIQQAGCDEIQGFWLSPPLQADEVPQFLRSYSPGKSGIQPG